MPAIGLPVKINTTAGCLLHFYRLNFINGTRLLTLIKSGIKILFCREFLSKGYF